jgi:transposase-like protein
MRRQRALLLAYLDEWHAELRNDWLDLADGHAGRYSAAQRRRALELVREHGVSATARILRVGRRTLQRWSREAGQVNGVPGWVRPWAERRRRERERMARGIFRTQ